MVQTVSFLSLYLIPVSYRGADVDAIHKSIGLGLMRFCSRHLSQPIVDATLPPLVVCQLVVKRCHSGIFLY